MKRILPLLIFSTAFSTFACGPWFPSSYISDAEQYFSENINLTHELLLIAKEYQLIDGHIYPASNAVAMEIDHAEFAAQTDEKLAKLYAEYSVAVRSGDTQIAPPAVPAKLQEFMLYLSGVKQIKNDPEQTEPDAWLRLLKLDPDRRRHRTVWVYYMLGNLAASHGHPAKASEHYEACRIAAQSGYADPLGLAHATYKQDFLTQTDPLRRLRCGITAVAYYYHAKDKNKLRHCFQWLQILVAQNQELNQAVLNKPPLLETLTLFRSSGCAQAAALAELLNDAPPLIITPRLAWFMYKSGRMKEAELYLQNCSESDLLANWLRFRMAQRNGQNETAIRHLRKWMDELQRSERIVFAFDYDGKVSPHDALYGNLGNILVKQNHMQEAMLAFLQASSYQDAALIAEQYLETDALQDLVESWALTITDDDVYTLPWHRYGHSRGSPKKSISCLLARRLFREGRIAEALPFYPPALAERATIYQHAITQSQNRWARPNIRSAYRFLTARILRNQGMELSGTELGPDYTINDGTFAYCGINPEALKREPTAAPVEPNQRFHYRYKAAELAQEAAQLAWNRHQKATILWCAGNWTKHRDPQTADPYFKQLARLRFQPLAKAADAINWFPASTEPLTAISESTVYIVPQQLIWAAKNYQTNRTQFPEI